jgi:hypothetical protein
MERVRDALLPSVFYTCLARRMPYASSFQSASGELIRFIKNLALHITSPPFTGWGTFFMQTIFIAFCDYILRKSSLMPTPCQKIARNAIADHDSIFYQITPLFKLIKVYEIFSSRGNGVTNPLFSKEFLHIHKCNF